MKNSILLFTLLFSCMTQATVIEKSFSDAFKIRIGGYLIARNDTILSATTPYLVGARIDLQKDLGMSEKTNSVRLDSHYRFDDFHKIEFSYYNIRNNNSKEITKSFEYNGAIYSAGAAVSAYLNLDVYKLNYAYSFYHNEKVELALAAGLHMIGAAAGLSGRASVDGLPASYTNDNKSFLAPLPVVGFRLNYAVTPRFHVDASLDYFGLNYDDYSGYFTDILLTAEYQVFDNWSVGAGLNATVLDVAIDQKSFFQLEQDITGVLFFVAYNY